MLASRIGDKRSLSLTDIRTIPDLLSEYHVALWRNATARLAAEQIHTAATWEAFTELAEAQAGFIRAMWCGSRECEEAIKAQTNATTRNMPFEDTEDTGACIWCGKKGGSLVYFAKAY
jgi:prolyl-tRNA synthetase